MRILLIEDDKDQAKAIKADLAEHFIVDVAHTGDEGEELSYVNEYDCIILDYMLPDQNGFDICRKIRQNGNHTPVIVLTAEYGMATKVEMLNAGADDYVTKPFGTDELIARIRAVLRRPRQTLPSNIFSIADLTIDVNQKQVTRAGKPIRLPNKEFCLLEYLARNQGRAVTKDQIIDHVWENCDEFKANFVESRIKSLRKFIDREYPKKLIISVRGLGYKLEA